MDAILNRRSIRKYKDIKVSDELVEKLLRAAMAAPSAGNEQAWEFIVLRDKNIMKKITEVHPYSSMLLNADVAIVVCGNESKEKFKGFWVQDCSAATENILIEVQANNLGAVWLGVYPENNRVTDIQKVLNLPSSIIPLSIIPVGYPDEEKGPSDRFDKTRIHYDVWK
jgi:nitroreductase